MKNNIRYQQKDSFTVEVSENENIWIEMIAGGSGLHLVNFSKSLAINEKLIDALES